jgi:hypothetical protein
MLKSQSIAPTMLVVRHSSVPRAFLSLIRSWTQDPANVQLFENVNIAFDAAHTFGGEVVCIEGGL